MLFVLVLEANDVASLLEKFEAADTSASTSPRDQTDDSALGEKPRKRGRPRKQSKSQDTGFERPASRTSDTSCGTIQCSDPNEDMIDRIKVINFIRNERYCLVITFL